MTIIEIEFEGLKIKATQKRLEPGDTYIAKRNTGWKLLTVKKVENYIVHPMEYPAYSFDECECYKVIQMEEK
jgi:hypothetical protein